VADDGIRRQVGVVISHLKPFHSDADMPIGKPHASFFYNDSGAFILRSHVHISVYERKPLFA
jgi:hypothetical protein